MSEEPKCECPGPGFCQRYQITQQEYPWKVCQGIDCTPEKSNGFRRKWREALASKSAGGPGIVRKVINATQAAVRHVVNQFKKAPKEVLDERAKICESNVCGFHNQEKGICQHPKCGCPLKRVLKGVSRPGKLEIASEKCPAGYWNAVEGE